MEVCRGEEALPEGGEARRRQKVLQMSALMLTIANLVMLPNTLAAIGELSGGGKMAVRLDPGKGCGCSGGFVSLGESPLERP